MLRQITTVLLSTMTLVLCAQQITPAGGGEYILPDQTECLSDEQRLEIIEANRSSIKQLMEQGIISVLDLRRPPSFGWPLSWEENTQFEHPYFNNNFVDLNPELGPLSWNQFSASNLDYNCGNRSYDTNTGYNHAGTDMSLWPFSWLQHEENTVSVVAADDGVIINKLDGNPDQNCSCVGNWNAVYLRHADGSISWYGHLKRNLLTTKSIGASVSKGEYLGIVGSSGCSTGPHLHFEVYDPDGNIVEPFAGNCNETVDESWWDDQQAYHDPHINAIFTHDAPPEFGCRDNEVPNLQEQFDPGDQIYTAFYYRDQLQGQISTMRLIQPDGALYNQWTHSSPQTYTASYWYWWWFLPDQGPFGTWTVECEIDGKLAQKEFEYGDLSTNSTDLNQDNLSISPIPSQGKIIISGIDGPYGYNLIDVRGQIVRSKTKLNTNQLDFTDITNGMYYLELWTQDGYKTLEKIILTR